MFLKKTALELVNFLVTAGRLLCLLTLDLVYPWSARIAQFVGHRTCDLQVTDLSPIWAPPRSDLRQATCTCMALSTSSVFCYSLASGMDMLCLGR